jgi:hypothetical protein
MVAAAVGIGLFTLAVPPDPAHAMGGFEARYSVAASGFEIGRATLSLQQVDRELAMGFSFENGALFGLMEPSLTRMHSIVRTAGRGLAPERYEAVFRKEDRERSISLSYGEDGSVQGFKLVKRGRVRLDDVPEKLERGTADPLAALLLARSWLEQAVEGDTTRLAIFDGRKRYEANLRYLGTIQTSQGGTGMAAHHVTIQYRTVAALDEDAGIWQPPDSNRERQLDALVSADGRYLPIRLAGSFDGLPLAADLDLDCRVPPGCP